MQHSTGTDESKTPNINPFKDPRWGRGQETPGEDPFRIKKYVKSLIPGLQGGVNPQIKKVIATCKHFAANDLEKWSGTIRHNFDAKVSTQELVEYYLPPFQQCARDSNVGSVMCCYNRVNGVPACASSYLMNTVLREHWGWTNENQYVVSDCNAIENIWKPDNHNYTQTRAQAAGLAYSAGTDNVCETNHPTDVIGAFNGSYVSIATIDRALKRQYEGLVRTGYFDPDGNSTAYRKLSWSDVNTPQAQKLARSASVDGIVLLKNDGTLPLNFKKNASVAVIGMWANEGRKLVGNYAGNPPYTRTPVAAAQALGLTVNWAGGPTNQTTTNGTWIEPALDAAKKSDYILYFGGIDGSVENEDLDRYQVAWPQSQRNLISQLSALRKPLVVVQMGTGLDNTPLLNDAGVSAIVWAGYPGQDGGSAVFDILTGKNAPAGRLPITVYPERYVNEVRMTEMSLRPSNTSPGRTYKFYKNSVHQFGYGLHYTKFTAKFKQNSQPSVYSIGSLTAIYNRTLLDPLPGPTVDISVTNTGNTTSDFVALVFVSHQNGPAPYPIKELVGYKRLRSIAPNATTDAQITVALGELARVDSKGNTILYPGNYTFMLDVPTQDILSINLSGVERVLDKWPVPPWDNATTVSQAPKDNDLKV